jgi:hypothetical protein
MRPLANGDDPGNVLTHVLTAHDFRQSNVHDRYEIWWVMKFPLDTKKIPKVLILKNSIIG